MTNHPQYGLHVTGPGPSDWCLEIIYGTGTRETGTETDYSHIYLQGEDQDRSDWREVACMYVPDGWELLEFTVSPTPQGRYYNKEAVTGS